MMKASQRNLRNLWINLGIGVFLTGLFLLASLRMDDWVIEAMPATVSPVFFPRLTAMLLTAFSASLVIVSLRALRCGLAENNENGVKDENRESLPDGNGGAQEAEKRDGNESGKEAGETSGDASTGEDGEAAEDGEDEEESGEDAGRMLALCAYVAVMFLYLAGLHYVGFVISTPPAMLAVGLMLGLRRWLPALICYVAFTLALDYAAFHFMQIILPEGVLFS